MAATARAVSAAAKASQRQAKGESSSRVAVVWSLIGKAPAFAGNGFPGVGYGDMELFRRAILYNGIGSVVKFLTGDQKMITGSQMRAARALLRWSVEELAKSANVSVMTIRRAEGNDGPVRMLPNNLAAIRAALESAGVVFSDQDGMVCVRLKPEGGGGESGK